MRLNAILAALPVAAVVMGVGGATATADATSGDASNAALPHTVIVQAGDSLSTIAEAQGTTYVRLYDANSNITNPDLIFPGESIRIPAAGEQLPNRSLPIDADDVVVGVPPASHVWQVARPAAASLAPPVASGSVWGELAQCESSGNWSIDTGNGFYGGLQFDSGTWLDNGGGAYAPRADLATPAQQIAIASKVEAARGWSPWPACSAKLGL